VVVSAVISACSPPPTEGARSITDGGESAAAQENHDKRKNGRWRQHGLLPGRIVSINATELRAPQNRLKIDEWYAERGWTKLIKLLADGTAVKKGDVVARFRFWFDRALPWVENRLNLARAGLAESGIQLRREETALETTLAEKRIAAARAAVDLEKERAISRRQLAQFRIALKQLEFDVMAAGKRLAAFQRARQAELAYHQQRVRTYEDARQRFFRQKAAFTLKAPHDGIVRHVYDRDNRRKVNQGDGVHSGMPVVSIAKGEIVTLNFFLPEERFHRVKLGDQVDVIPPRGGSILKAKVTAIEPVPQELGFLLNDEELPNARERAFVVVGTFAAPPQNLPTGSEVRARLQESRR
jgi:hypothetical protein